MQVDICRLPEVESKVSPEDAVIVVDALRASATVVSLLETGATRVQPVTDRSEIADESAVLTVGEHRGKRLDGFDFDNSPRKVRRQRDTVAGSEAVILTTNGTQCVAAVNHANAVLMGSMLNKTPLVKFCIQELSTSQLWLLPARRHGDFAAEDLYSVLELWDSFRERGVPTETTLEERAQSLRDREATAVFTESNTGEYLAELGKSDDILFCASADVCTAVPMLEEGSFVDAA